MLSWIVYSGLITFHKLDLFTVFAELITLCINLIDYLLHYYRYYCSDLLCTVFM